VALTGQRGRGEFSDHSAEDPGELPGRICRDGRPQVPDMAILATSGPDWADRSRRLAARMPDLDIFSQGLVAAKVAVGRSPPGGAWSWKHGGAPRRRAGDRDGPGGEGRCGGAPAAVARRAREAATRTSARGA
jgi:hypothetical protein